MRFHELLFFQSVWLIQTKEISTLRESFAEELSLQRESIYPWISKKKIHKKGRFEANIDPKLDRRTLSLIILKNGSQGTTHDILSKLHKLIRDKKSFQWPSSNNFFPSIIFEIFFMMNFCVSKSIQKFVLLIKRKKRRNKLSSFSF